MKKIVIMIMAVVFTATCALAAGGKIAYLDTQEVFDKTKAGKKYQGTVKEYYENRKKILDTDAEEIQKLQEDYKKQAGVMNEKARKEKESFIGQKISEFEKKRNEFGMEVEKKRGEVEKEFNQMLTVVLKDLAKKEKISLIVNKSMGVGPNMEVPVVLYGDDDLDVTQKVITELDKKTETK